MKFGSRILRDGIPVSRIFDRVTQVRLSTGALVSAGLFALITGSGLLNEGFNSDDWRHFGGIPSNWAEVEGRWVMDFIFRYILAQRFLLPIQLTLAFACFLVSSILIAKYSVPGKLVPVTTVLVFAVGVNHPYMCDALNFHSHIFAYPFALACSIFAFHLLHTTIDRTYSIRLIAVIASAQLLATSLGTYQSFALFGLIIPVLVFMRVDRFELKRQYKFVLTCFATGVIAILLYQFESDLYLRIQNRSFGESRFQIPALSDLLEKLLALLNLLKDIYSGGLLILPEALSWFSKAFSYIVLFSVLLTAILLITSRRIGNLLYRGASAIRLATGAGAALSVVPILFWFMYREAWVPARAVGYIGFFITAVFLAVLTVLNRKLLKEELKNAVFVSGFSILFVVGVVNAMTSSMIWHDRSRIGSLDSNMAGAIFERVVNLEGYDGKPFRLVGGLETDKFSWGSSLGLSVFHADNPQHGIFKELYNLPWRAETVPFSPKSCPAFPANNAVFMYAGEAYVCLNEFPEVFPLASCVPMDRDGIERLCLHRGLAIQQYSECESDLVQNAVLRMKFVDKGKTVGETSFHREVSGFSIDGKCYKAMPYDVRTFEAVEVSAEERKRGTVWTKVVSASQFSD
ncbi:MAG: glucosyltransferase domain-containing protein [Aridibacter famidurans]|nr:glucosyltransferase domain-containing protein [Aridibacter famidurans]